MTAGAEPTRARGQAVVLAALGIGLTLSLLAFVLMFLGIPKGWSVGPGWAPLVSDLYREVVPLPQWSMTQRGYQHASLSLQMAAWTLWLAALWLIRRAPDGAPRATAGRVVMAVAIAGRVLLMLLPPLTSSDLFRYALFGKMIAFHDLNPLVTPARALVNDPLLPYAGWLDHTSIYGPPFLWLVALVARICGDHAIATVISLKAIAAAADIAVCWLIGRLARNAGSKNPIGAMALYAWCPVAMLEGAVAAHTEPLMMALALGGLVLAQRGRHVEGAFALFVISASVKYVSATLGVLYAVHAIAAEPDVRRRLLRAARLLGTAIVVLVVLYAPFFSPEMLGHALEHLSGGRHLASAADPARPPLSPISLGVVALLAAASFAWVLRGGLPRVTEAAAVLMLAFLQLIFQYQFPWYFLAPLAVLAPGPRTRANHAILVVTLVLAWFWMMPYGLLYHARSR